MLIGITYGFRRYSPVTLACGAFEAICHHQVTQILHISIHAPWRYDGLSTRDGHISGAERGILRGLFNAIHEYRQRLAKGMERISIAVAESC